MRHLLNKGPHSGESDVAVLVYEHPVYLIFMSIGEVRYSQGSNLSSTAHKASAIPTELSRNYTKIISLGERYN